MSCEVRIGASGWHYKHWRGPFYAAKLPAAQMLPYYLRHFDTVEINNSFYKLPSEETFAAWRDATPSDFRFAVKASRFITHNKKLKDPENAIDNLLPRAAHLESKLGPVLFQLPPRWRANVERLENLLQILPRDVRYAFEFRELSWMSAEVDSVLTKFNAAFCIYELAGYHSSLTLTADFTYVRLHGPEAGKYQGSYSETKLRTWARQIESWARELRAVYVYFDNDDAAHAVRNALTLKSLVAQKKRRAA